jgi:hypothetical protein
MPLYNGDQSDQSSAIDMSQVDAIRSITRARKSIKLVLVGSIWNIDIHDGTGMKPVSTVIGTRNYYDPPFSVRSFNLCDDTESIRKLHYDSAGDGVTYNQDTELTRKRYTVHIVETFFTNGLQPIHITRVYLDALTTATEIHLHG